MAPGGLTHIQVEHIIFDTYLSFSSDAAEHMRYVFGGVSGGAA